LAALPAGIFIILFVYASICFLFPLKAQEEAGISRKTIQAELKKLGPVSRAERIALIILLLILAGWFFKPFHGIKEAWIALGGLLLFLTMGLLDKKSFRINVDWGLILFFGIVSTIAVVSIHLKIDQWFVNLVGPVLTGFSFGSLGFFTTVTLMVCIARLFLRKSAVVILFTLTLVPLAKNMGIHPGAVLLTRSVIFVASLISSSRPAATMLYLSSKHFFKWPPTNPVPPTKSAFLFIYLSS